jgi:hypothetical protein
MDVKAMRDKREALTKELQSLNEQLSLIERACIPHDWDIPQPELYDTLIEEADGIEAHGSDVWVKTKMIKAQKTRWKRKCHKCGKTEYTEQLGMPKNIPQVPIFPGE